MEKNEIFYNAGEILGEKLIKKFGNKNFDEHFCYYTSIYTFYEIIVIAINILQQAGAINKLIRG